MGRVAIDGDKSKLFAAIFREETPVRLFVRVTATIDGNGRNWKVWPVFVAPRTTLHTCARVTRALLSGDFGG